MAKVTVSKNNKTVEKMGEVVEKVISLIEEKNLLPWDQGFVHGAIVGGRLINHLTRRPYSGANLMTLLWLSIARVGDDFVGEYMTAAAAKGAYGTDTFPKKGSMKQRKDIGKLETEKRIKNSLGCVIGMYSRLNHSPSLILEK